MLAHIPVLGTSLIIALLLSMHVLYIVILRQDDDSMKAQDDVRRKSYNEPTLEDKFDKSQMPKPMQV